MSIVEVVKNNLESWDRLRTPPSTALKKITGGRMAGKTDIKPQWRYQAMTEVYGPCGMGWKFTIDRLWKEEGPDGNVFAFAKVSVYTKTHPAGGDWQWSDAIPGVGGNKMVEKEKAGLHANDECFKMAVTDALSTALKMLGVAADIYLGAGGDSKYPNRTPTAKTPPIKPRVSPSSTPPENKAVFPPSPPPAAPQASEAAPESPELPKPEAKSTGAVRENVPVANGIIDKVAVKPGKKSDGTPFERYGVLMDGKWYNTFSKSNGNLAITARDKKLKVDILYTVNADGYNDIEEIMCLD